MYLVEIFRNTYGHTSVTIGHYYNHTLLFAVENTAFEIRLVYIVCIPRGGIKATYERYFDAMVYVARFGQQKATDRGMPKEDKDRNNTP